MENLYFDNERFLEEFLISKRMNLPTSRMKYMMYELIQKTAQKLSYNSNNERNYMIAFAYGEILQYGYWKNYNRTKCEPFRYFSEIVKRMLAKAYNNRLWKI